MNLSQGDIIHLQNHEACQQLIRARVMGVVKAYATGFYLHGEGGIGKSFEVITTLEHAKANFKLINSRVSGRALFDLLAENPDVIFVIEDAEFMTKDKNALGVLRSALWGQGNGPRLITWTVHREQLKCWFTGGIILIGNRPLEDIPELRAVKTRIPSLLLQPTNNELAALMRSTALRGFQHGDHVLSPEMCWEVCEYVITKSLAANRNLDMRLLHNTFMDCAQWRQDHSAIHWHDLLESRLKERVVVVAESRETRAGRIKREQEIAHELSTMTISRKAQARLWEERTGKSSRAYYRRLTEITSAATAGGTSEPAVGRTDDIAVQEPPESVTLTSVLVSQAKEHEPVTPVKVSVESVTPEPVTPTTVLVTVANPPALEADESPAVSANDVIPMNGKSLTPPVETPAPKRRTPKKSR
jgi:hypothetical protein